MVPKKQKSRKKSRAKKGKGETFAGVKESMADIGKTVSGAGDRMTDILLNDDERDKKLRGMVSVVKEMSSGVKSSLGRVSPRDVLCDASYELGKFSKIARNGYRKFLEDVTGR